MGRSPAIKHVISVGFICYEPVRDTVITHRFIVAFLLAALSVCPAGGSLAQDMFPHVDLGQDAYSRAEMARADVESRLAAQGGLVVDLVSISRVSISMTLISSLPASTAPILPGRSLMENGFCRNAKVSFSSRLRLVCRV